MKSFTFKIILVLFGLLGFCLKGNAQALSFTLHVTPTTARCYTSGTIEASLTNLNTTQVKTIRYDLSSTRAGFQPLSSSGTATSHTFINLRGGTYTLKVTVTDNSGNSSSEIQPDIVVASTYLEPFIVTEDSKSSIKCLNTGSVSFYFEGGENGGSENNFKYNLSHQDPTTGVVTKLVDKKVAGSYSFDPSLKYSHTGLASGNYTIELIDECGYTVRNVSFTIGSSTDILPDGAVASRFRKPQGSDAGNDCRTVVVALQALVETNEFHSYWNGSAKGANYEYGWGTGSSPASWNPFTTYDELSYTFSSQNFGYYATHQSEIPKLFIRLKNPNCSSEIKVFPVSLEGFELDIAYDSYKCKENTYDIYLSIGGSKIGCGMVSLSVNDSEGNTLRNFIPSGDLLFGRSQEVTISGFNVGTEYTLVATDGSELTFQQLIYLDFLDISNSIYMESTFDNPCEEDSEGYIAVRSSYRGFKWGGYTVKLISSPGGVIPPMFEEDDLSYTFSDLYGSSLFYLFSDPNGLLYYEYSKIPTGLYELEISNMYCSGIGKDTIKYYYAGGTPYTIANFELDTLKFCGSKKVTIEGDAHLITQGENNKRPIYIQVYDGVGNRETSVQYFRKDGREYMEHGSASPAGYLKIDPEDPNNDWEQRGYMVFQKAGNYNVRVSADTDFSLFKSYYCMITSKDISFQIERFGLNELNSGAYACGGRLVVSVSAQNGGYEDEDGTYHQTYSYELYKTETEANDALNLSVRHPIAYSENIEDGDLYTFDLSEEDDSRISEIISSGIAYVLMIDESCGENTRFVASVPIANFDGDYTLSVNGGGKYCVGDDVTLTASPLGGNVTYTWSKKISEEDYEELVSTDPTVPLSRGLQLKLTNLTLDDTGDYKVSVNVCGKEYFAEFSITVAPKVLIWRRDAANSEWNNTANWAIGYDPISGIGTPPPGGDPAGTPIATVPAECTTVHIPGGANVYPDLVENSDAVCDVIVYHFGGETGSPHRLKYNKAYVEYNWGYYSEKNYEEEIIDWEQSFPAGGNPQAIMQRNRWYMISSPLMRIASGDFSVAGYPNTYQRLFNATNPQSGQLTQGGFTEPFNTPGIDLKAYSNSALAVWIPSYNSNIVGLKDHKNLDYMHGKMRMPYIEYNESYGGYQMYNGQGHAMHRYNNRVSDGNNMSIFPYYYEGDLSPYPENKDPLPGKMYREIGNSDVNFDPSRFVFEQGEKREVAEEGGVKIYKMSVVGVSAPDPANKGEGEGAGVYVMIGNPLMSHLDFGKFAAANSDKIDPFYKIFTEDTWHTERVDGTNSNLMIPPLQSFIIKLTGSSSNQVLNFPLSGENRVSTTNPGNGLRSSGLDNQTNELTIKTSNSAGKTEAAIVWGVQGLNNIDLLYSPSYPNVPQVFVVGEDFMYNTVQYEKYNRTEIPLGVYSALKGEMTLSFSGVAGNTMLNSLYLWDKKLNKEQDLFFNPVYTFDHQDDMEANRFVLRAENSQTNTKATGSYFNVHADKGTLYVQSSVEIQRIRVSTVNGVTAMEDNPAGTFYYSKSIGLVAGVYIVSVDLADGNREIRKIIVE